jgi:hypothetical protein
MNCCGGVLVNNQTISNNSLATAPGKDPGNMAFLSQNCNFEAEDYSIISNIVPFQAEI